MLGYGLFDRLFDGWTFALDNRQWNPIHKKDYIRSVSILTTGTHYRKLFRKVEDIILWIFPIDVLNGMAFLIAINGLLQSQTKNQKIIGLIASLHQAFGQRNVLELLDSSFNIGFTKLGGFTSQFYLIDMVQALPQNIRKDNITFSPIAHRQC